MKKKNIKLHVMKFEYTLGVGIPCTWSKIVAGTPKDVVLLGIMMSFDIEIDWTVENLLFVAIIDISVQSHVQKLVFYNT